ncbi:hypothetical protein MAR_006169 [Mya arenaria]|uniref:Uncharacterized protein n=1 Tax=Mya arenaria TaxID=6604 RepID=A0ABY7D9T0_MYAAR|nr:hypothetical protein MAR_006169 [Mya arenaria]
MNYLCYLFLIAVLFTESSAIDCYECSTADSGCGEVPDEEMLILDQKVTSGCNSCVKEFESLGTRHILILN